MSSGWVVLLVPAVVADVSLPSMVSLVGALALPEVLADSLFSLQPLPLLLFPLDLHVLGHD